MKKERALEEGKLDEKFMETMQKIPSNIVLEEKNEMKFFKLLTLLCKNEPTNIDSLRTIKK